MGLEPTPTYRRLEPDGYATLLKAKGHSFKAFSAPLFDNTNTNKTASQIMTVI